MTESDYLRGLIDGRKEMQSEIDRLTLKHEEMKSNRLDEFQAFLRKVDQGNAEIIERLKGDLEFATKCWHGNRDKFVESQRKLAQAKSENAELRKDHEAMFAGELIPMVIAQQIEKLSLTAENYRAILAGLIDSSDRGDTGTDSSYASYWAEARQSLEDGK
jgi:hypothetical protein